MIVISADFTEVIPYQVDVVSLGVGQRADILVKANGKPTDSYWMRANISGFGSLVPLPPFPYALAAIYYDEADTEATPTSTPSPAAEANCGVVSIIAIRCSIRLYANLT